MIRDGAEAHRQYRLHVGAGGASQLCALCGVQGALATLTHAMPVFADASHPVNQLDIGWMNSDHERADRGGNRRSWFHRPGGGEKPFGRILDPAEVARAVLAGL